MNWYVLVCTNLWSNEVSNHERKRQHEHFHTITSHLGMFLTINVYVHSLVQVRINFLRIEFRPLQHLDYFSELFRRPSEQILNHHIPVYAGTYLYVPVHTSTYQYILVCTGMYKYIPVHTSMYKHVQYCNSFLPG